MKLPKNTGLLTDNIITWALMGLALFTILHLHLLAALLAGLLVFQLVHLLSSALHIPFITSRNTKIVVVALLGIVYLVAGAGRCRDCGVSAQGTGQSRDPAHSARDHRG